MIAQLRGQIESIGLTHLIIDVNGVGYLVMASSRTLQAVPPVGSEVRLFIQTQIREDSFDLFGFLDEDSRDIFNLLLTVQGVGARVALAIQSALSPEELLAALQTQDKTMLTRADGVGPKLAARLVMELKDKVGGMTTHTTYVAPGTNTSPVMEDAIAVLVRLGYRRSDVLRVTSAAIGSTPASTVEDLVKIALKLLTRG